MSRILMTVGLVGLLGVSAVQAAVLDISIAAQGVATYNTMVADAKLRGDGLDGASNPFAGDNLGNASGGSDRFYSYYLADGTTPNGRQNNFVQRFDVSSIPIGSTIISANLTTYFANQTANNRTFVNVKLSQLQPGKGWVEGVGQSPATDGSVTWNHQAATTTAWAAGGALGASDIFLGTTQTFDLVGTDGAGSSVVRDITSWVQDWVNTPANNTGMLWWGGNSADSNSGNRFFWFGVKEDGAGPSTESFAGAPTLVIEYTVPEPGSAVLLGAGLLALIMRRRLAS